MTTRSRILSVAIACVLCTPLLGAQSARVSDETASSPAVNETSGAWFVELASPPAADGTSLATVRADKAAFRRAAAQAGLRYTERYAYDTLFNGLSIRIDPTQASRLARIDGVKAVYPVVRIEAPPEPVGAGARADLAAAIAMTGADIAQNVLHYTGAGVKVAIIDTGIDYNHPDLGGNGVTELDSHNFPTARVLTGWDFVGEAFNADPASATYNPVPAPDAYPDDCNGHGTHVSGIVGANGEVTGVAPGVTFGAYRVFGCEGSTESDIMIAAMERVLADGMQVLNMSIGAPFQWPQYPTSMAATRLVNKGVVVVASIGNSGANGLYAAGAPGVGDKVIGVASYDNIQITLPVFTISPDDTKIGFTAATAAPLPPTSGSYPMARTGTPTSAADACNPLPAGSLAGTIALIRRGTCSFNVKAFNAQNAGAIAVVLYNNVAGRISPTVLGPPTITIPVVAVSDTEGVLINNRLAAGPVDLTWTTQVGLFPNATGGLISSFSSYGVAADLSLKPDIGAPGGSIYSTYPLELGGHANLSGTSMSSPHVAGAAALLLQARPNTPAQAVRSILQNTAEPKNWQGSPGLGFLDQVQRQGAGMLAIDKAILSTTKIEPGKLALGESEFGPVTRTLTITNKAKTPVTYTLSHVPALSTGPNTFTVGATTGFASVAFSAPSITLPKGGVTTVNVTVTANSGLPDKSLYGGYIVFSPVGGGQVYRVPYVGFKGDYQSIVALTPTANGFPWLAKLIGTSYFKQGPGAIFTFSGDDVPFFLFHLDHQVARLRMDVFDAVSGKAWHRAVDDQYWGRNSASTSFFGLWWDGTTKAGNRTYTIPNGQYVIVMSVLKANGDPSNPAHWETWTSPAFYIAR